MVITLSREVARAATCLLTCTQDRDVANPIIYGYQPAPDALIAALTDLTYNLRWSWQVNGAMALFRTLAPDVWEQGHNPVDVAPCRKRRAPGRLGSPRGQDPRGRV